MRHPLSGIRLAEILLALALTLAGLRPAGAAKLDLAYWAPDRGTPYRWFEGAKEIQSFFTRDYVAAGNVVFTVRNDGARPVRLQGITWNGRPVEELRSELAMVWWRMLPDSLPVGRVGEVIIRPREPLAQPASVTLTFDDGSRVEARIAPVPAPIRIETVGYTEAMDEVFLVVEALDKGKHRLGRVWLDGQDVTVRCRLLDPGFSTGLSPVVLKPAKPLAYGSYHTYRVDTASGASATCCLRAFDGWVPLGSYGFGTYEEYARNGCNGHNNFGRHGKGDLDTHTLLGMRAVMILGDQPPEPEIVGHPGIFAYGPMDEPDCSDYALSEIPAGKRIGAQAMEMVRRFGLYRKADPRHLGILTVDLTYKPANYYIYGPIPDVLNPDCYPFCIGADATMVREVVETARRGAGPRPVTFTFQGQYEEHDSAETRAKQRFARPPFAGEERLMLYYAIGAGARGLYDYIHCTEKASTYTSRGSGEFPDVWHAIGRVYRELEHVAPLLARSHPAALAKAAAEKVYVSTLVAGADALLLVVVNEEYTQDAGAFRVTPRTGLPVDLPALPWLKPAAAWRVREEGFSPIPLERTGAGARLRLDRLEVAELILVSANPAQARALDARYRAVQAKVGAGLLGAWRRRQAEDAVNEDVRRRLAGEFAECAVMGKGIEAYGVQNKRHWNPANEGYWGFEFGQNDRAEDRDRGAEWSIPVPAGRAGAKHRVYTVCSAWGQPARFVLVGPDGKEALLRRVEGGGSGQLLSLPVAFPAAGDYTLRYLQGGPGPKAGSVARAVYVIAADRNPPDLP